jgi:hypothetical protein
MASALTEIVRYLDGDDFTACSGDSFSLNRGLGDRIAALF